MIVWLASYPKSGNTFLRAILSSLFFSKDGNFDFKLLKYIHKFPSNFYFENIGININNDQEVAKNYIQAQEKINNNNSLVFMKTHSSFCKLLNEYNFSDLNNTLGVIYVVRDPRAIVDSFSHHTNQSSRDILDLMINSTTTGEDENEVKVYIGSWSFNFNSWKIFEKYQKYLLIKYEDLVNHTPSTIKKIINFINLIGKSNYVFDDKKIENVIKSTAFNRLRELEKQFGFDESEVDKQTGKKNIFFRSGLSNNLNNLIDINIKNKLEKTFEKEMKELGYL